MAKVSAVDLVLVEGFKASEHPKIEAHRKETGAALLAPGMPSVRGIASDCGATHGNLAAFDLDDSVAIADFIAAELGL